MATQVFDTLKQASFAGFPFPVSKIEVTGGLRDHVHEYPHTPGGAPEKLGRKLYDFSFTVPLYQGMPKYPKAFPETMQSLLIIFEGGGSFDLVIPILGTISAYAVNWKIIADPKTARNGVSAEFTFREDQSNLFLVTNLIAQTTASLASTTAAFQQSLTDYEDGPAEAETLVTVPDSQMLATISVSDLALFNQILSAANTVLSTLADVTAFGFVVADAAAALVALCALADATATCLSDPTFYGLLYALHNLWDQAQQLEQDALQTQLQVATYDVPAPGQPVGVISSVLYGDTSHALELMQTNEVCSTNPFLVPGGSKIRYYVSSTMATAA